MFLSFQEGEKPFSELKTVWRGRKTYVVLGNNTAILMITIQKDLRLQMNFSQLTWVLALPVPRVLQVWVTALLNSKSCEKGGKPPTTAASGHMDRVLGSAVRSRELDWNIPMDLFQLEIFYDPVLSCLSSGSHQGSSVRCRRSPLVGGRIQCFHGGAHWACGAQCCQRWHQQGESHQCQHCSSQQEVPFAGISCKAFQALD